MEEEAQVDAGDQQHQERVERRLPQHEGPVVGEDLAQELVLRQVRQAQLVVDPAAEAGGHEPVPAVMFQKPGPMGVS